MTRLPGIGAATRLGVSRAVGLSAALARAALPQESDREAFRARAIEAFSDLWDVTVDALLRAGLIERTVDRLLSEDVGDRVSAVVVEHPATERVMAQVVDSPGFERLVTRVVESPGLERLVTQVVESPGFERLLSRVVESPAFERLVVAIARSQFIDELLDRALASDRLDVLVAQVAESKEVHDALWQQGAGVADDVTDELRSRTIAADAVLERLARALIRRRSTPRGSGPAGAGAP